MNQNELYHHGILGQKWGIRRYQNPDGSLTDRGKRRYNYGSIEDKKIAKGTKRALNDASKAIALDTSARSHALDSANRAEKKAWKTRAKYETATNAKSKEKLAKKHDKLVDQNAEYKRQAEQYSKRIKKGQEFVNGTISALNNTGGFNVKSELTLYNTTKVKRGQYAVANSLSVIGGMAASALTGTGVSVIGSEHTMGYKYDVKVKKK